VSTLARLVEFGCLECPSCGGEYAHVAEAAVAQLPNGNGNERRTGAVVLLDGECGHVIRVEFVNLKGRIEVRVWADARGGGL
jgi:hypothetical protein